MSKSRLDRLTLVKRHLSSLQSKNVVHIESVFLVHGPNEDETKTPCKCCGSLYARVVERRPGPSLLIDLQTGDRVNRPTDPEKAAVFDDTAKKVKTYTIPFRCYAKQLDILFDKHKVVGVFGGNRSGKSAVGVTWMALQWLIRGGRNADFWLVAHNREQTHTLMNKLILGEYTNTWMPPVLPLNSEGSPLLATYWPESLQQRNQYVQLVDGSRFVLHHASKRGGNLKGKPAQAILLDEGTEVQHRENWTVLIARLLESGGQLMTTTTPMPGHWLREEVVEPVDSGEAKHVTYYNLSQVDNPWLPQDEVKMMSDIVKDRATYEREVMGQWASSKGRLYQYFDPDVHVVLGDGYSVEGMVEGARNVTAKAQLSFWSGKNPYAGVVMPKNPDYVAGQDFNVRNMAVVIAQVIEFEDGTRGLFVVDEVILMHASAYKMRRFLSHKRAKLYSYRRCYPEVPIACDPNGAYYSVSQVGSDRYSTTDVREMVECGFDCRPCRTNPKTGKPQAPPIHDRVSLVQRMFRECRLLIASRCTELVKCLLAQEDNGAGRPVKVPGRYSDRISGPIDALGYLVWALFSSDVVKKGKGFVPLDDRRPPWLSLH